ncbi:MAG: amidohydrolase family protein [Planctomycetes bacterium]|nr:amidohydrolase family protein [Planctomycetota bacterium]
MRARAISILFAANLLALAGSCASTRSGAPGGRLSTDALGKIENLAQGEQGYALVASKVFALDEDDHVYSPGMVLVRGSKIAYVGPPREVPAGYAKLEYPEGVVCPGMVDLHSHVQSGGFGDVNDMVMPVNPEFRASSAMRPSNPAIKRACASGITTLYGIPGSGTSLGGFGLLYKTKTHASFDDCVIRSVGGMKVAQAYNPERRAGDLGLTRAGLAWMLENINHQALGAEREGRFDPALANLQKVHRKEIPVLIHCAGSDSFPAAARMWKTEFDTNCVLSHGCFDAHLTAPYEVGLGVPINAGPRTIDYYSTRDGALTGIAHEYEKAGVKHLSLNTDSPVVPEEELFLQGSISAHMGADSYQMLRAVTINPALVFGLGKRLGSLEPGKDADVVVRNGEPLDPRSHVETVLIDGAIEYDWKRDGQWF